MVLFSVWLQHIILLCADRPITDQDLVVQAQLSTDKFVA